MKRLSALAVFLISLAAVSVQAAAFSYSRTLTASENWFDSNAWLLNGDPATWVNPGSGDTASAAITTDGATPLTLTLDQAVTLNGLSLSGSADLTLTGTPRLTFPNPATLAVDGQTLRIEAPVTATTSTVPTFNSSGTLEFAGSGNTFTGGNSGGNLAVTAGTLTFSGNTTFTAGSGSNAVNINGPAGRVYFKGDAEITITSGNSTIITRTGSYNATTGEKGTFYLMDNAKLTSNTGTFYLGASSGNSAGDFFQQGGEVHVNSTFRIGWDSNVGQESVYSLSKGLLSLPQISLEIARRGSAALVMTGGELLARQIAVTFSSDGNDNKPGRAVLTGGTVTLGDGGITAVRPAIATLTLGATTLKTTADKSWTLQQLTAVTLEDATTGTTFAPAADQSITLSSPLVGDGKLVLNGDGTLIMNAAHTYTGGTVVESGTLRLTQATHLPAGDTLLLSGGSRLELSGTEAFALTPASLTLNDTTVAMKLNIQSASDTFTTDTLVLGENGAVFEFTFGEIAVGSYPLITAQTITGDIDNLSVNDRAGLLYEFRIDAETQTLFVDVTNPQSLTWNVSSGNWSNSPADANWLNDDSGEAAAFSSPDRVTFGDVSEAETVTVTVTEPVIPGSITVNNTAGQYLFTGEAPAAVTTFSLKADTAGANAAFTLPVTVETLAFGENAALAFNTAVALGASPSETEAVYTESLPIPSGSSLTLTFPEGFTQRLPTLGAIEGTLKTGGNGELSLDNTISIEGQIENTGGTLTLNQFSGSGTITNSGTGFTVLKARTPSFTGQVHVTGGSLRFDVGSSGGVGHFSNSIYNSANYYPLLVSGGAEIIFNASEVTSWSTGQGGYCFADLSEGATIRMAAASTAQNLLKKFRFSGDAFVINEGSGSQANLNTRGSLWAVAGTTTFTALPDARNFELVVGASANDFYRVDILQDAAIVFTTPLAGSSGAGLRKTGVGRLQFDSGITHNLKMNIEEGTLVLGGTSTGNAGWTIGLEDASTTATLRGSGTISGATSTVTVNPGSTVCTGLTVSNLTLADGSTVALTETPSTLATTAVTATGTVRVDISETVIETYGKICDVLTWQGSAPEAVFTLPETAPANLKLVLKDSSLTLYRIKGVQVILD